MSNVEEHVKQKNNLGNCNNLQHKSPSKYHFHSSSDQRSG